MCDSLEYSRLLRCLETLSLSIDAMYPNTHCSKMKINGKKLSQSQFQFPGLSLCSKKHSLAQNSLGRGLFYLVNVLLYFKIA